MPIFEKRSKKDKKGFTLVELLVVMAIIGILATVILAGFRSSQRRSRDAKRKSDLKQIAESMEIFYSDYQRYPSGSDSGEIHGCPYRSVGLSTACKWGDESLVFSDIDESLPGNVINTIYFRTLPSDPSGGEYYYRTLYNNQAFQIFAHLENPEDAQCVNGDCTLIANPDLTTDACGGDGYLCNFAITSANVSPVEVE